MDSKIRDNTWKCRIEHSIQYTVEDLNSQTLDWCLTKASGRKPADDTRKTVGEAFTNEQEKYAQSWVHQAVHFVLDNHGFQSVKLNLSEKIVEHEK